MGVSKNRGKTPQIMNFNRVFHYKPSILRVKSPYFWVDIQIATESGHKDTKPHCSYRLVNPHSNPWIPPSSQSLDMFRVEFGIHPPKVKCKGPNVWRINGPVCMTQASFVWIQWRHKKNHRNLEAVCRFLIYQPHGNCHLWCYPDATSRFLEWQTKYEYIHIYRIYIYIKIIYI